MVACMSAPQDTLPLFPLSNVVLFPGLSTPLHLFEPRYRQLARDVLAGDRSIGMVVVRPEFADEMAGDPPVYPIGCWGRVTESQKLPDGRINIVLQGERRFRISEELPRPDHQLYRSARVVPLEDPYPEAERERVARLRASITEDVTVLVRRTQPERASSLRPEFFAGVDDVVFVNLLSNAFALPVEDKQGLLEAETIPARFARLASVLRFQRVELEASPELGRGRLH
jgi:Lon protease-like protein